MKPAGTHIAFHDLIETLDQHPDRVAIVEKDGRTFAYSDFKEHIVGAQLHLKSMGIKKGDKVLVFVPMSFELYVVLEALFSIGATALFLDPWMKGKKMSGIIRDIQPDLLIVTKKIARYSWLLPATWRLKKWKLDEIPKSTANWDICEVKDEDNALITFTSGTSGKPKGANRTFSFLHAQATVLKDHLTKNNKVYTDLTNFPIVGLADLAVGNKVVIPDIKLMKIHSSPIEGLIKQIYEHQVNRLIVSPALFQRVFPVLKAKGTGSLSNVITGGAPIPIQMIHQSYEAFPDIHWEAIYGSTEAEPICLTTFEAIYQRKKAAIKGVYVGEAVPGVQVKIIRLSLEPIDQMYLSKNELQAGEVGELVVTGEHVNKRYYQNQKAFEKSKVIDDSGVIWHRTGDLGYFEDEHIYLVGRDHRLIIRKEEIYYPYPIEQHISLKFGLDDVGYVQIDDEILFFIGSGQAVDSKAIKNEINAQDYPIDRIILQQKALPRDDRHKSKLQIQELKT